MQTTNNDTIVANADIQTSIILKTNLRVGFIGASKTGTVLAHYLQTSGINVVGMFSRTAASLEQSCIIAHIKKFSSIEELVDNCDIIIISTTDNAISAIWNNLVQMPQLLNNKTFCHFSGLLNSEIFSFEQDKQLNCNIHRASLHPVYSFTSKDISPQVIKTITFTLEGDDYAVLQLTHLLKQLGNDYHIVDKTLKTNYHLAAVLLSSGINSLFLQVQKIFPQPPLLKLMLSSLCQPIIERLLLSQKINITGPIARGDLKVLKQYFNLDLSPDEKSFIAFLFDNIIGHTQLPPDEQQKLHAYLKEYI